MFSQQTQSRPQRTLSMRSASKALRLFWLSAVFVSASLSSAAAANFTSVVYDPSTDELIATLAYRGTHPRHTFSLRWGECKEPTNGQEHPLDAEVLDSDWRDAAREEYTSTVHFDLAAIPCRPALVTLRIAPRFFYEIHVPARPHQ